MGDAQGPRRALCRGKYRGTALQRQQRLCGDGNCAVGSAVAALFADRPALPASLFIRPSGGIMDVVTENETADEAPLSAGPRLRYHRM